MGTTREKDDAKASHHTLITSKVPNDMTLKRGSHSRCERLRTPSYGLNDSKLKTKKAGKMSKTLEQNLNQSIAHGAKFSTERNSELRIESSIKHGTGRESKTGTEEQSFPRNERKGKTRFAIEHS